MRILIVSDNHGRTEHLKRALRKEKPYDLLIHLGDAGLDEKELSALAECPVEMVAGNCDYFSELPKSKVLELLQHRVMITHGHLYDVSFGVGNLNYAALEAGADIVMFGHTHLPLLEYYDKLTFLNPGSIEQPRQANHLCSYALMVIDPRERTHFEIKYIDK